MDKSLYRTRNGNELPIKQGDYFIIMRHENDEPEDANTNAECEFIPGYPWPVAEGWTVLYWLEPVEADRQGDEKKLRAEIERLKGLIEAFHDNLWQEGRINSGWTIEKSWQEYKTENNL